MQVCTSLRGSHSLAGTHLRMQVQDCGHTALWGLCFSQPTAQKAASR